MFLRRKEFVCKKFKEVNVRYEPEMAPGFNRMETILEDVSPNEMMIDLNNFIKEIGAKNVINVIEETHRSKNIIIYYWEPKI